MGWTQTQGGVVALFCFRYLEKEMAFLKLNSVNVLLLNPDRYSKLADTQEELPYIAFLLQGICQIAVGVWEVWLQFNSTTVSVNSQVNETLLIVDTGQVSMDNCMVGAKTQGSQVSSHSPENIRSRNKINILLRFVFLI